MVSLIVTLLLLTKCTNPIESKGCREPLKKISGGYECIYRDSTFYLKYYEGGYLYSSYIKDLPTLVNIDTLDIVITSDSSFIYTIPKSVTDAWGYSGNLELICNEKIFDYKPLTTGIIKHERKTETSICD